MTDKGNQEKRAGGCSCGAARYEISAPPEMVYACHCYQCQKRTGSAFSLTMVLQKSAFTRPEESSLHRLEPSAGEAHAWLCRFCGSRLWKEAAGGNVLRVPLGTLDESDVYFPAAQFWLRSAQPWARIRGDLLDFETQPENLDAVASKWRWMRQAREGVGA